MPVFMAFAIIIAAAIGLRRLLSPSAGRLRGANGAPAAQIAWAAADWHYRTDDELALTL